jgi:uncharacterized membrane protein YoaK (UPF0700 family)
VCDVHRYTRRLSIRRVEDRTTARRDLLLMALTVAAGWADALSYVGLGHVFTANMTGNAALLGLALSGVPGLDVPRSAIAIAGFAVGAVAGSAISREPATTAVWPARLTLALGVETVVLAAFAATWYVAGPGPARQFAMVALAAVGMGIQSAAISRLAVPGVTTTYVTGTLTGLMGGLAALRIPRDAGRRALVLLALVAGAAAAGMGWRRWPGAVSLGPVVLVGAVALAAALERRR